MPFLSIFAGVFNVFSCLQNDFVFVYNAEVALLTHFEVNVHENYFLTVGKETEKRSAREVAMLMKLGWATRALQDGVERAHIIAPTNGALIEELFTAKDGTGTCISHDTYESVHPEDDSGDNESWTTQG